MMWKMKRDVLETRQKSKSHSDGKGLRIFE
jgi:hypothetical protein